MSRLTRQDYADIQAYIDYAIDVFAGHGLTMHVNCDMDDFSRFITGQPASFGLSASHDPLHSYLTPENAFWIWLEDKHGERVASASQKLIRTQNFIGTIFSHKLYDSVKPVLNAKLPEQFDGADESEFAFGGNISYGSGLFVHPRYRGRGFLLIACVSRTIALRYFEADWFVAIQRLTETSHIRSLKAQLYAHCKPFLKGMPYKWDGEFQISWSSRAEWLAAIRQALRDAGRPLSEKPHSPSDRIQVEAIAHNRV